MLEIYKNFKKFFYNIWTDVFCNYTIIFISLFGKDFLDFHIALAKFYNNVYKFFTIYKWQNAIFLMAIKGHTYIVSQQPIDSLK